MEAIRMWEKTPSVIDEEPVLEYYKSENKKSDGTVIIFPGGGYNHRAVHEGEGYARYLNSIGLDAFVCQYRVWPHKFPLQLLDARRAVRFVRANAEKFGINCDKVAVMGSSAGGHLSGLVSTNTDAIEFEGVDEIDKENPIPNATILCYSLIHHPDELEVSHQGCFSTLMPENSDLTKVSPDIMVTDSTPPAFIWHTSGDPVVNVINAYLYATALKRHNIPHEMHIFAKGGHGLGLADGWDYVHQWAILLENWFKHMGWLPEGDKKWR